MCLAAGASQSFLHRCFVRSVIFDVFASVRTFDRIDRTQLAGGQLCPEEWEQRTSGVYVLPVRKELSTSPSDAAFAIKDHGIGSIEITLALSGFRRVVHQAA